MLRRPPTTIELKLDDIRDYELMRQQLAKDQEKQKGFTDTPPPWTGTSKTKDEVYSRIGYVPPRTESVHHNPIM